MIVYYGATDRGAVREGNEDNLRCVEFETKGGKAYGFFLADGMGGHAKGEIASSIFVNTIIRAFQDKKKLEKNFEKQWGDLFTEAFKEANMEIFDTAVLSNADGMGTTGVAALVTGEKLFLAWVGDSRAYKYSGGTLVQLSRDHSLVQNLIEANKISREEARNHPKKNVITRAVGLDRDMEEPERRRDTLKPGDILMLCSDGLTGELDDNEIAALMSAYKRVEDSGENDADTGGMMKNLGDSLIESAIRHGGKDNVTVIVALYQEGTGSKRRKLFPF